MSDPLDHALDINLKTTEAWVKQVEELRAEVEKYKTWAGKVIEDHRLLFVETERLRKELKEKNPIMAHYEQSTKVDALVSRCKSLEEKLERLRKALEKIGGFNIEGSGMPTGHQVWLSLCFAVEIAREALGEK